MQNSLMRTIFGAATPRPTVPNDRDSEEVPECIVEVGAEPVSLTTNAVAGGVIETYLGVTPDGEVCDFNVAIPPTDTTSTTIPEATETSTSTPLVIEQDGCFFLQGTLPIRIDTAESVNEDGSVGTVTLGVHIAGETEDGEPCVAFFETLPATGGGEPTADDYPLPTVPVVGVPPTTVPLGDLPATGTASSSLLLVAALAVAAGLGLRAAVRPVNDRP